MSFVFQGDTCVFTAKDDLNEYPITCGFGRWHRGETALPGTPPRLVSGGAPKAGICSKVAAGGRWKDETKLELTFRFLETPHHDTWTCSFEGSQVQISFMSSIAQMSPKPQDKRPDLRGQVVGI